MKDTMRPTHRLRDLYCGTAKRLPTVLLKAQIICVVVARQCYFTAPSLSLIACPLHGTGPDSATNFRSHAAIRGAPHGSILLKV
eukprot:168350-Chlamydomonas_euryale.AAC.3